MPNHEQPPRWTEPEYRLDIVRSPGPGVNEHDEDVTDVRWFDAPGIREAFTAARVALDDADGPDDRYGELWTRIGKHAHHLGTLHVAPHSRNSRPVAASPERDTAWRALHRAAAAHVPAVTRLLGWFSS